MPGMTLDDAVKRAKRWPTTFGTDFEGQKDTLALMAIVVGLEELSRLREQAKLLNGYTVEAVGQVAEGQGTAASEFFVTPDQGGPGMFYAYGTRIAVLTPVKEDGA